MRLWTMLAILVAVALAAFSLAMRGLGAVGNFFVFAAAPTGSHRGGACRSSGSWLRTRCSCPGEEAWQCRANGRFWSDGRCYVPGRTCNPTGAHYGAACRPVGSWTKTACACGPVAAPPPAPQPPPGQLTPGLRYSFSGGYHVVVADLASPATEVHVAPPHATPAEDRRTVSAHAQEVGAVVAINAN